MKCRFCLGCGKQLYRQQQQRCNSCRNKRNDEQMKAYRKKQQEAKDATKN